MGAAYLPPSSFPHLHPAKSSGAKMGEGSFQLGHELKCSLQLYIPLPQIPCSSAFGGGREGGPLTVPTDSTNPSAPAVPLWKG